MKRVILVSGMSGAGKTSAMSVLEDMGYHCIDQYPVQLLSLLVDLIENSNDIRYNSSGSVAFDPEGKSDESGTFKESILNAPFDFEKIKALAERIWAAKPEE